MFRRRACVVQGRRDVCSPLSLAARTGFFDSLSNAAAKAASGAKSDSNNSSNSNNGSADKSSSSPASGLPPGIDLHRLRTMQEMLKSQPPEKQKQLMEQALAFQKTMSKVPGFGKLTEKNVEMMQQLLNQVPPSPPAPSSSSAAGPSSPLSGSSTLNTASQRANLFGGAKPSATTAGPSLDDLKKVNLGSEIESLFAELKTMRMKKNEYRDKYYQAQAAADKALKELAELAGVEQNIRQKLKKAEQDVMLVTSENLQLREDLSKEKALVKNNKQLQQQVREMTAKQQASTEAGSPAYTALQQQLQEKENAIVSLQRKINRIRQRDPLHSFSVAFNELAQLCDGAHDAGKDSADRAMSALMDAKAKDSTTWNTLYELSTRAYVCALRRLFLAVVPYSHYDAVMTVSGNVADAKALFESAGFATAVEAVPLGEEGKEATTKRLCVTAPASWGPLTEPGPFGYAVALQRACSSSSSKKETGSFMVSAAQPVVSEALLGNEQRSVVTFTSARSSGPGGQAVNVSETHIYAKVAIDGQPAFSAEAQDSRSALQNRELALEKLRGEKRLQHNKAAAREARADEIDRAMAKRMADRPVSVSRHEEQWKATLQASHPQHQLDAALVGALREWVALATGGTTE